MFQENLKRMFIGRHWVECSINVNDILLADDAVSSSISWLIRTLMVGKVEMILY